MFSTYLNTYIYVVCYCCFSFVLLDPTVSSSAFYADFGLLFYIFLLSCLYISVSILMSQTQSMDESDSGAPSAPPGSNRNCQHFNKVFKIVHKGHRSCSHEYRKACQALNRQSANMSPGSANKSNKRKKDNLSPDKLVAY